MSTSAAIANHDASMRRYELGAPIIRREQRLAFERIHRDLAQTWSDALAEYIPGDAALEFEGLDFNTFSAMAIDDGPCSQVALFTMASMPASGFFMMSEALAKFLVSRRLGMRSDASTFTRIEAAIARETMRSMLARLGETYATAGLGSIANVRECDDLADSFFFAPEDALATLRFRLRADAEEMRLLVALSASVVTALAEHHPVTIAGGNGRNAIANVARHLPIDVDVVLGSWKVPLDELMQLRAGDKIVLPDGEDAWLAARGVRIRRASVEISASGASVEIRRSARLR